MEGTESTWGIKQREQKGHRAQNRGDGEDRDDEDQPPFPRRRGGSLPDQRWVRCP